MKNRSTLTQRAFVNAFDVVAAEDGFLMVGFNRRFDPHFMAVRKAIDEGQIGTPEMAIITSRDPEPRQPNIFSVQAVFSGT